MYCIRSQYYGYEQEVAEAIRDNTLTRELCAEFLTISDEMFKRTGEVNTLARAAVRHRLSAFAMEDGLPDDATEILEQMIEELSRTTQRFGRCEDWDEYLEGVSYQLADIFTDKGDTEKTNKYISIAKEARYYLDKSDYKHTFKKYEPGHLTASKDQQD